MEERIQKILSGAGVCSRRRAEEYLTDGRVRVNGRVAALGEKADPQRDRIEVDGVALSQPRRHTYLMLHKPRGYVTTLSDEKGRKTGAQLVESCGVRVWPVGRLDMDSEGLLLLTDDGDLTHKLTHPSHEIPKEYHVRVNGEVDAALPILSKPMVVDGEDMAADQVEPLGPHRLKIVIHQGKNRQVRRMCAAAGLTVTRLVRVREGNLRLGTLQRGTWRHLTCQEAQELLHEICK